ncbi:hypothetical protein HFK83_23155 [Ralstonia pseudosolanacearum]|uniref:hypothetical protein n=1 Tax=Ralstonia pseudosolanacearum TaxID=1310165 RepID=UPI000675BB26|nr:hypothetical protein [Ralstonia pseudosolanacearum]MCK4125256.1 hypothetical protein [Ralstonia pseudosolanacearum]
MAVVSHSHATFYLLSQRHAGERRADAVSVAVEPAQATNPQGRSLTEIAKDRVKVRAELAAANSRYCVTACATLRRSQETLAARLDALDVEAAEAKRREVADDRRTEQLDRVNAQRDAARDDPVMAVLTSHDAVATARGNFLMAIVFSVVFEAVACLCWYVALHRSPLRSTESIEPVASEEAVSDALLSQSHESVAEELTQRDCDVVPESLIERLRREIAAGHVRETVISIRNYLRCSQERAIALRRELKVLPQRSDGRADRLI